MDDQSQTNFSVSDLPASTKQRIYHLDLKSSDLAANILIVGDPQRVPLIADAHFSSVDTNRSHRGLCTATGTARATGQRVSVVTSGMGTPSLEIVLQEIVALNETDLATRRRKGSYDQIRIVRVGTSGGLQPGTALGTPIVTSYAIGMDNTGLFYNAAESDAVCERIECELHELIDGHIATDSRFRGRIWPYVTSADFTLVQSIENAAEQVGLSVKRGLTISNSGFFANQGRDVARIPPTVPEIDRVLARYDPGVAGERIENMEMESSFLFHFMKGLGYQAASICPAIANRVQNTFAKPEVIEENIHASTEIALRALAASA